MKTSTYLPAFLNLTAYIKPITAVIGLLLCFYAANGNATSADGGIITQDENFVYHSFLSSGPFTVTSGGRVDVLVVAGGGGGGARGDKGGGGGGAGGLIYETNYLVSPGVIAVTVGSGGNGGVAYQGGNGGNSVFADLVASGGGGGAYGPPYAGTSLHYGLSGGSGGGASEQGVPGSGVLARIFHSGV